MEHNPHTAPEEQNAVLRSLQLDAALGGKEFSGADFYPNADTKNIYFLSVYRNLQRYLDEGW